MWPKCAAEGGRWSQLTGTRVPPVRRSDGDTWCPHAGNKLLHITGSHVLLLLLFYFLQRLFFFFNLVMIVFSLFV